MTNGIQVWVHSTDSSCNLLIIRNIDDYEGVDPRIYLSLFSARFSHYSR